MELLKPVENPSCMTNKKIHLFQILKRPLNGKLNKFLSGDVSNFASFNQMHIKIVKRSCILGSRAIESDRTHNLIKHYFQ